MTLVDLDINRSLKDQSLDTLLCLVALIMSEELPEDATVEDGERHFHEKFHGDCEQCPTRHHCLTYRFYE